MSKDWAQRLAEAGWQAGDIYVPPSGKRRTANARLQLLNRGLWSRRLVDGITEGRILSRYRRRHKP